MLDFTLVNGIKCYSLEEATRYSDYPGAGFDLTDKLEEDSFWVRSRNRLLKEMLRRHKSVGRKTRLLEIGCGTGAFVNEIIGDPDFSITGSEIYLKGLAYAKQKLPSAEFIQLDITQGRLSEEFDLIAAFDVIEHIEDDVRAIGNIHDMLPRGGHFILTVPQYQFLWSRLDEIVKHKRRYSRADLLGKLERAGFEVRYCSSFLFVLFPLMAVSRLLDRRKAADDTAGEEFESRVRFPPLVNRVFDWLMRIDEFLILRGVSLPFGGSLLVVARKP